MGGLQRSPTPRAPLASQWREEAACWATGSFPVTQSRGDPIVEVCCSGFLQEPPHVRSPNTAGVEWEEGRAPGASGQCSPPACPHRGQGLPREKSLPGLPLRVRVVSRFSQAETHVRSLGTQTLSLVALFNFCCCLGSAGPPLLLAHEIPLVAASRACPGHGAPGPHCGGLSCRGARLQACRLGHRGSRLRCSVACGSLLNQ